MGAVCWGALVALSGDVAAQVSAVTIRGTVRTPEGAAIDGARVRVLNAATGVARNAQVVRGRFLVHGLEVGGPYSVEVRHLGFQPQVSATLFLTLGEPRDLQFVLQHTAVQLGRVVVTGSETGAPVHANGGSATTIRDSLVHRLPTLNRNFIDFVQLAPQVSTKIGFQRSGMSAAGANLRFNAYLINGADERLVNGSVTPAHNSGKSVPIDAVKEYQVLVAPYDVRYGDFAGAMVNTVTQSGTNDFHGSTFAYGRNNRLARGGNNAPDSLQYERLQYGFSLGGPIVRDRIHFFIAPELQQLSAPSRGPYIGQPPNAEPTVPVSRSDVERFASIARQHGLEPGSAGFVEVETPLRNLFLRLDASIPRWNSRAVGFVSYAAAQDDVFERSAIDFFLSSSKYVAEFERRLASLQLYTDLTSIPGGHNEFLVSRYSDLVDQVPDVRQPLVRVSVPGSDGGTVTLNAGTPAAAHGRLRRTWAVNVKDELTVSLGARHVLVLGLQGERFRIQPRGVQGGYGTWSYANLDDFQRNAAERFDLRKDLGSASAELRGGQYSSYVGDDWRVGDRVSFSLGLRGDVLHFTEHAPYNAAVDSIFGRRTNEMPRPRLHLSPRVGFTWDLEGGGRQQLRGGVGIFTGRPPLAWIQPALSNYGVGIGVLNCGFRPNDAGPPPPFDPDYRDPPTACSSCPRASSADSPKGSRSRQRTRIRALAMCNRPAKSARRPLRYGAVRVPCRAATTMRCVGSRSRISRIAP